MEQMGIILNHGKQNLSLLVYYNYFKLGFNKSKWTSLQSCLTTHNINLAYLSL